jgi:3-hydroxyisobutyrate dehydrogenase
MRSTADTPSRSEVGRVGFIGLGDMGGALATRIIGAGFPTVLWARRPHVLTSFEAAGVETAATPAELAAGVDMVGICVWDDDAVREVMNGPHGVLAGCRPGTVVAIHSTVLPATCRELATVAGHRGVPVVDAPVSGGRDVAFAGKLVVAVGGDAGTVARIGRVLSSFGDPVVHVGDVGTGQVAKLVNNSLLAANLALADDALTLAKELGVPNEAMVQVLRNGSGRSFALEVAFAGRTSAEIREQTSVSLSKDVRCLVEQAAPGECADVALFAHAARAGVQRVAEPMSKG